MNRLALSRTAAALALAASLGAAQAAPLVIGLITRADDERLEGPRAELAFLGHPTGPAQQAVEVALRESQFELEAAKLQPKLEVVEVRSPEEARAAAQRLEKAGAAALLAELPADALLAASGAVRLPVFNIGESADALRQAQCRANLFHTLPSERMRSDALAQHLVSRRWNRVLLLHGPRPADAQRLASVEQSLKRYGLKTVAKRPFKLSADPRERDLANPVLLTGGGVDHDIVWVVDTDGEFARTLPYRTALPRPVVGDAGLFALAWAPNFERFGAPQLARRFARHAKRPMTGHDWAAWMATKAVLQAATAKPAGPWTPKTWVAPDFTLDGFKGTRLSFRPWDRQLRQPLLLTDGQGTIGSAPVEGLLHPSNVLDTLGVDAPEKLCKAAA